MNLESFREYCLAKKGVTEEQPFGPDVLVYKVKGKMFALTGLEHPLKLSLKNTPEKNEELRAEYDCVVAGYHLSKKHWNTVTVNGSVKDLVLKEWIGESYEIIVKSLPKKIQEELNKEY